MTLVDLWVAPGAGCLGQWVLCEPLSHGLRTDCVEPPGSLQEALGGLSCRGNGRDAP